MHRGYINFPRSFLGSPILKNRDLFSLFLFVLLSADVATGELVIRKINITEKLDLPVMSVTKILFKLRTLQQINYTVSKKGFYSIKVLNWEQYREGNN